MLSKKERLTGKDIQYILRSGKKVYGNHLIFVVSPQYRQHTYSQRSVQIPVKLDKRAVMRNLLKRTAKQVFVDMYEKKTGQSYKVFIFVNKKGLEPLKDMIATGDKTAIVKARKDICRKDFTLFFNRVGATLSPNSQTLGNKGRNWSRNGRKRS